MPGPLTPPAIAAKGFITVSIPISSAATAALSAYGATIAPVIANLASATASITTIHAILTPLGAIAPPSKVGMNITGAALAQIATVNATIVAATAISVPPTPAFAAAGLLVTSQLTALEAFISTGLVLPLSV
mgnify:FL=1|tara:strand:- start:282 stop:677 length:396 start_codon:yes stop_codon:yes gene_type:complete